jgi:alpha-beta hydrolase superfamily lysophospholipase
MSGAPIVIVGGATWWPASYRGLANTLREISGSEVHVVPVTPVDWAVGYLRGFGQLVFDVASTVDRALLESEAKRVVLVGHSAGGLACRVYIGGDHPYGGRRYSGHRRVERLITLGTPHVVRGTQRLAPISRVNGLFPGALHAEAGLRYAVEAALLPGSESHVVDGVGHNRRLGRWYGSDRETVGQWWPEELRVEGSLVGDTRG